MNAGIMVCIVSWVYLCVYAHEMNVIKGCMEFVFSLKQILFAVFFLIALFISLFSAFSINACIFSRSITLNIHADISFGRKIENKKKIILLLKVGWDEIADF